MDLTQSCAGICDCEDNFRQEEDEIVLKRVELSKTRQARILEFTKATAEVSDVPRIMTRKEVQFLVKMNCEELMELLATVFHKEDDIRAQLASCAALARPPQIREFKSETDVIANQVDALVDIDYFNGNAASKVGWDMDEVFDVVHEANMKKKHDDASFRKVDGKVIKPPGWTPPDVEKVVRGWFDQ